MKQEFLDNEFSLENFINSLGSSLPIPTRLSEKITHLSVVQSQMNKMLDKNRKRIFIESSLKNGKTTSLFLFSLRKGIEFDKLCPDASPIIIWIYFHKSQV